jgi:hypothetical protein
MLRKITADDGHFSHRVAGQAVFFECYELNTNLVSWLVHFISYRVAGFFLSIPCKQVGLVWPHALHLTHRVVTASQSFCNIPQWVDSRTDIAILRRRFGGDLSVQEISIE